MSFDFFRNKGKRKLAIFSLLGVALLSLPFVAQAKLINLGTTSDVIYVGGNIGVGTTNPANRIQIGTNPNNHTGNDLTVSNANGSVSINSIVGAGYLYGSSRLDLYGNNTNTMSLSSGNVGIGLTNPAAKLQITSGTTPGFINSGSTQFSALGGGGNLAIMVDNTGTLYTSAASTLPSAATSGATLRANGTSWIANTILYNNGTNIGVGKTNPAQALDVNGVITAVTGYRVNNAAATAGNYLRGNGTNFVANTIQAADVPTLNQNTTGYASTLYYEDNRQISPSELANNRLKFGFTAYNNNSASPYADFLHLRSYTDVTGGADNLLVFNKSGLGMRLYQQAFGSTTAYTTYKDVVLADNTPTLNYLLKYSATGATVSAGNSLLFDNGSNVGIGLTNPTAKFQISPGATAGLINSGSTQLSALGGSGTVVVMADNTGTLYGGSGLANYWSLSGSDISNNNAGNVGIGTITPQKRLDVIADANNFVTVGATTLGVGQWAGVHFGYRENNLNYRKSAIVFERTDNSGGGGNAAGKIHILNGPAVGSGSATLADARLTIGELGNVGIGTTNPGYKLEIGQSLSTVGANNTLTGSTFSTSNLYFRQRGAFTGISGAQYSNQIFAGNGAGDMEIYNTSATGNLVFGANSTEWMRIQSNGNVGIGTTNPLTKLYANGTVTANAFAAIPAAGEGLYVAAPGGARYHSSTATVNGAIKIVLPQSWSSTMMRMKVEIYEYSTDRSFTVYLGGYNYSTGSWINTFAQIVAGKVNRDFNVRFGHDGTRAAIWIGETSSSWSYPQVAVTEFYAGFSNYGVDQWDDGWDIVFDTDFTGDTMTSTESNNLVGQWLTNGTHVYNVNSGNVGIGLTNPGTKLDIVGTFRNSLATTHSILGGAGNVLVTADNNGTLGNLGGTNGSTLRHNGTSWISNTTIFNNGTNVGIGITNPSASLHVNGGVHYKRTTFSNVAYTALATDYIIANTGVLTANRIVTLPTALCTSGRVFIIVNEANAGAPEYALRVTPQTGTISGMTYFDLKSKWSIPVYCNGTDWFIY